MSSSGNRVGIVVRRDGARRIIRGRSSVMTLLHNELARRDNGRLELRPAPVRVRWNLDDLVTSDGHKLHCAFTCSVAALSAPSEKRMLEEVFLTRAHAVTTQAVAAHFTPGLKAALAKLAGKHTATEWVE